MKLSAFADRKGDANKDLGRQHALDAYTIVGMMTEGEYDRARMLADRSRSEPHFLRVWDVVAAEFSGPTSAGIHKRRTLTVGRGSQKGPSQPVQLPHLNASEHNARLSDAASARAFTLPTRPRPGRLATADDYLPHPMLT